MAKINIKTLSLAQLNEALLQLGCEGYRANQVKQWLYQKDVTSFDEMLNLSKELRQNLSERFTIDRHEVFKIQQSEDGTRKYLFKMQDGKFIESVLIPEPNRVTLCISSQVGCAMDCKFCNTATMGLKRNLSQYEILEEVAAVRRDVADKYRISNIVFMGMGEPLTNTKNLYPTLEILLEQSCFGLSRNHITVSTSGIAPEIEKFGDQTPVKLAVSLNATTDEVRDVVMPINKKYPLKKLFESLKKMHLPKRNRITFEYVMLHGVNDTEEDAYRLVSILSQMRAKVNLIPFNEFPGNPYKRPPDDWVLKFQKILLDRNLVATIRKSRGRDILGACGQLAYKEVPTAA